VRLPGYAEYKQIKANWFSRLPAGWQVRRLSSLARVVNGYPFDAARFTPNRGFPLIRIRDLGRALTETNYDGPFVEAAAVTSDDLLIGMDGDFNVGRWLGSGRGLLNQRMCCVRGLTPAITRFLEYALPFPLQAINDVTYSTTVKHLSSLAVEKIRVPAPCDNDLDTILQFLDRETAKIDALVGEQERLIELLKEKRQAVISHAVTKGLNPSAPMKDSGHAWIGSVPTHWDIVKMKWVATMDSGHTPDRKIPEYWDGDIPWVSLNDTAYLKDHEYVSETAFRITERGIANSSAHLLPERAVVFSRDATIGRCAITTKPMAVSQHFIAWICGERLVPEYLLLRFRSMGPELDSLTTGATLKTIGMPEVRTLMTPLPPVDEQRSIVKGVRQTTSTIDALIAHVEHLVTLLQERRTALISAAVTGQIDVRAAAERSAA